MAGTNNFLVFDQNNINIESDTNYSNDPSRLNGVGSGIASSLTHNKLYRQVSIMAAALAQFLANCNNNVSDTNLDALTTSIVNTLATKNDLNALVMNKPVNDTGTANNYIISTGYNYNSLFVGMIIKFKAANANTGASSINVDNLGFIPLVKGTGTALTVGDITANQVITAIYDGINFEITSAIPTKVSQLQNDTGFITALNVNNALLTTTSAATTITYTPNAQGNFEIDVYLRVSTSATNVTVTVTYADNTGPQTKNMIYQFGGLYFPCNSGVQLYPVGSYPLAPLFINAVAGTPIVVTVTASIANQVSVSSSIVEV